MDAFSKRIQTVMEHYGLSASRLADKCGVQRSAVSHILNGRNRPSVSFLMALSDAYPDLNTRWLLHGKGEMITTVTKQLKQADAPSGGFSNTETDPTMKSPATTERMKVELPQEDSPVKPETQFTNIHTSVNKATPDGSTASSSRKVVKVILLYDDGSFSAHLPGNTQD